MVGINEEKQQVITRPDDELQTELDTLCKRDTAAAMAYVNAIRERADLILRRLKSEAKGTDQDGAGSPNSVRSTTESSDP